MYRSLFLAALVLTMLVAVEPTSAWQLRPRSSAPGQNSPAMTVPAPEDVAAPPEGAIETGSGLAWRRLGEAAGGERPGPYDLVEVRYSGWQTDGVMFDSTEIRGGKSREFKVNGVIEGFEEAVQLLSVGEKGRFWVPEELAYGGREGKPAGMLVFDLELIDFTPGPTRPESYAAPPAEATHSESGLAWLRLKEGDSSGLSPGEDSTLFVEYSSWTTDGRLLDATKLRGEPELFTMGLVIEGFREAFSEMHVGERRLLWIPPELTELDGTRVHEGTVVFDIELISFVNPPQTPVDVSAIPDDAQRSISGLAWRVMAAGGGKTKPVYGDTVEVLYSGWTRNGAMFDSTYNHGRAGRFELDDGLPIGWNEALFGMVEGEKRLVWIPEDLAYGGVENRPKGMLIFEIELVSIAPSAVDGATGTP